MQHGNHLKQGLILAVVLFAGLLALGVPSGSALLVAVILACPIGMAAMMFFMTRGSHDRRPGSDHTMHHDHDPVPQQVRAPVD